jgi:hypothetical protein
MTNHRCVRPWHRTETFAKAEGHVGPSGFFYDLAPPAILDGRYVEPWGRAAPEAASTRSLTDDPIEVSRELQAAHAPGRAAGEARRITVADPLQEGWKRGGLTPPCVDCGNRVPVGAYRASFSGAPQS